MSMQIWGKFRVIFQAILEAIVVDRQLFFWGGGVGGWLKGSEGGGGGFAQGIIQARTLAYTQQGVITHSVNIIINIIGYAVML